MFTRKWILTTLLVIAAVGVMVRLGIWQLDRLEKRRAFNARVTAQITQPELLLAGDGLKADLTQMEYRKVKVRGQYDPTYEIALRNQAREGRWGVNLITPLKIEGSDQVILIDRGWIPAEDYTSGEWGKYAETGVVEVQGVVRASQTRADIGRRSDPTPAPGAGPLKTWNLVNVKRIDDQTPYNLLPVYIQQSPNPAWTGLPARGEPRLEITEGSHMGYAIQWFFFAALLGLGYPFFIRKQEALPERVVYSGSKKSAALSGRSEE